MECKFCKIIDGEIKVEPIFENERAMSFLDIHPCSLGHSLVMPKNHHQNIFSLSKEEVVDIFDCLKKTAHLLEKVVKCDGFNIGINHNEAGGQAIMHLHIHIIPRWFNDGGGSMHLIVSNKNVKDLSLDELQKKLKEAKMIE